MVMSLTGLDLYVIRGALPAPFAYSVSPPATELGRVESGALSPSDCMMMLSVFLSPLVFVDAVLTESGVLDHFPFSHFLFWLVIATMF